MMRLVRNKVISMQPFDDEDNEEFEEEEEDIDGDE